MQFTGSSMAIMNRRQIMFLEKFIKIADKTRQIGRINCSVLNDCNRFTVTWYIGQKTESRFTELPDPPRIGALNNRVMIAEARRT